MNGFKFIILLKINFRETESYLKNEKEITSRQNQLAKFGVIQAIFTAICYKLNKDF